MSPVWLDERAGDLRVIASSAPAELRVALEGSADVLAEAAFAALVARIDDEARRVGPREVVLDICGLEFMNSSCFKSVISWLLAVRRLPAESRYTMRLRVDANVYWQRRSLTALAFFGGDAVVIDQV